MDRGGPAIETWVEPCPRCGSTVAVASNASRVTCGSCSSTFAPDGKPTVIGRRGAAQDWNDPADSLVGTRMGRWTLTRLIGRGGMGRVYEATDERKGRRAAVKVLREDLAADPSFVRRFHREARLLASLAHPHVVDVIDRGEEGSRLWFAMDYVRGESLRRLIDRGPLAPKEAARIAREIASALAYAHGRGVIHRDLKPENVLLDEQGVVHLVDFGLSRLVSVAPGEASTRLTRTDVILGTYEYMSPEQRRGERELDGRADVFALGVILYEMLTGSLPLGRFTPPSDISREIPAAFDDIVNRALATNPKDRFASAAQMETAIDKAHARKPRCRRKKREKAAAQPQALLAVEETVPHHEIEEARSALRHIEIIAALDRAGGLVLVLGALGLFSVFPFLLPFGLPLSFFGVIVFILGIYLLNLGSRIQTLQSSGRQSQITASVLMLFLPPFFTALGIYSLIVMTSDRARKAFGLGRDLLGDKPHPIHVKRAVPTAPEPRPRAASLWMRAFCFFAILWSLYACFLALDVFSDQGIFSDRLSDYEGIAMGAGIAAIVSFVVMIRMFFRRKKRRGFGLALIAFLFLYGSTALLNEAVDDARNRAKDPERAATIRVLPRSVHRHHHTLPLFGFWERSK